MKVRIYMTASVTLGRLLNFSALFSLIQMMRIIVGTYSKAYLKVTIVIYVCTFQYTYVHTYMVT